MIRYVKYTLQYSIFSIRYSIFKRQILWIISGWVFMLCFQSCNTKVQTHYCTSADIIQLPSEYDEKVVKSRFRSAARACRDALAYAPDTNYIEHRPMRYIRVNVHFVNSSDSSKNFIGKEALNYAKNIINNVNQDLSKNAKMHLPIGNNTPVLPTQYRLKLTRRTGTEHDTGVYCHFDDELCYYVHKGKNRNLHKQDVIKKYGIQLDSVLNVFVMPHHPDSLASKTYAGGGVGVALGTNVKMAGMYESGNPFWHYRQILSHEVGHVFGLQHSWLNDGCEDTPKHPNCWNRSKNGSACDSLASNNLMDYNAWQLALTPCQIGRIHRMISTLNSRPRKLVIPTWCDYDAEKSITIQDSIHWKGAVDMEGDLLIAAGGTLQISCRLSLPKGAKITIAPGGKLILKNAHLHNACGDQWKGIEIQEQKKEKGEVVMIGEVKLEDMEEVITDNS
ncbi:MAG: reprolysin-like metallopeptidase [Bacteroidota bacterium]